MRFRSTLLMSLVALAAGCALADSTQPSVPETETFAPSLGVNLTAMTKITEGLYYQDVVVGTGTAAQFNKIITVYYSGYLKDGAMFDSNVGKDSLRIPLNNGVIQGWVLGLPNMKAGGTRKLVVGSSYGYGAAGSPPVIPGHATLIFDIQLKRVE